MLTTRRPTRTTLVAVVLAVLAAALSGACWTGASTASTSTSASGRASSTASLDLLAFTAPAIGGGEVDAAAFAGRPALLWFWAPW